MTNGFFTLTDFTFSTFPTAILSGFFTGFLLDLSEFGFLGVCGDSEHGLFQA